MSTETIQVTLPDGATREVQRGTTAAQIAHQISPRLAKEALVARADGELVDLSRPLEHDAKISILTAKDPDAVQVFRHSAAHLLAAAVMELYPDVKLGIGPPIDNGFFYEFVREEPFTSEDLEKIEAKMHELAAKDVPNERKMNPHTQEVARCCPNKKKKTKYNSGGRKKKHRGADGFFLHPREIPGFLPRAAHPLHRTHQGIQADERSRRVLERPGRQSADAADLRRLFRGTKRSRRISAQARRSQAPRSPQAGPGARSFQHPGRSRLRLDFLASQGRHHSPRDGRLAAR